MRNEAARMESLGNARNPGFCVKPDSKWYSRSLLQCVTISRCLYEWRASAQV